MPNPIINSQPSYQLTYSHHPCTWILTLKKIPGLVTETNHLFLGLWPNFPSNANLQTNIKRNGAENITSLVETTERITALVLLL